MAANCLPITSKYHPGQILAFSGLDGPTCFEFGLAGRTSHCCAGIDIMHPGFCQINFGEQIGVEASISNDFLELKFGLGTIRAAFIDAHHLLIEGKCSIVNKCDDITVVHSGTKTLVSVKAKANIGLIATDFDALLKIRKKWLKSQKNIAISSQTSQHAYAKALSILKSHVCWPQGQIKHRWTSPDRWPHRGMWLWDSAFHAIGWRHIDPKLAQEMLDSMLDVQYADGMIPHYADPLKKTTITQPPVLALAAKLINDVVPDWEWIERIYPKLCKYITWDLKNRDADKGGLLEWFIDEHENCRSGESGMDNSPRFDAATTIDAVDFNSYVANECEILSEFSRHLRLRDDMLYWQSLHQKLCSLINDRFWNDEKKIYVDYFPGQGRQSEVIAGSGFLPLITGKVTADRVQMLADHIRNQNTFGSDFPIATIAACDQSYSKDMWRGPTWVNLNWLASYGFNKCGLNAASDFILRRTIDKLEYYFEQYGTFFEFYDDRGEIDPPQLLRKSKNDPTCWVHQVIFDYGWSAALYVDMIHNLHLKS